MKDMRSTYGTAGSLRRLQKHWSIAPSSGARPMTLTMPPPGDTPKKARGLLMSLHGLVGKEATQLRLDYPEFSRNGKAPKFLTPSKQANTLGTSPLTCHGGPC